MTDGLADLLSRMRQHPAFKELLETIEHPSEQPEEILFSTELIVRETTTRPLCLTLTGSTR